MELNLEKEVALLTKRLQEETTKSIRYQALLDDALQELEHYKGNNETQDKEVEVREAQDAETQEPKFHVVEDE